MSTSDKVSVSAFTVSSGNVLWPLIMVRSVGSGDGKMTLVPETEPTTFTVIFLVTEVTRLEYWSWACTVRTADRPAITGSVKGKNAHWDAAPVLFSQIGENCDRKCRLRTCHELERLGGGDVESGELRVLEGKGDGLSQKVLDCDGVGAGSEGHELCCGAAGARHGQRDRARVRRGGVGAVLTGQRHAVPSGAHGHRCGRVCDDDLDAGAVDCEDVLARASVSSSGQTVNGGQEKKGEQEH